MKRLTIFLLLLITFALSAKTTDWKKELYKKAGTIEFIEPELFEHGTTKNLNESKMSIDLYDVIKLRGHICPGSLAAFLMTKKALNKLYPKTLPVRGNVEVTAAMPSGVFDISTILLRAGGERVFTEKTWVKFDKKLKNGKKVVIVYKRKDTGKSVKLIFDKQKALAYLGKGKVKEFFDIHFRASAKKATNEEIVKFGKMVQDVVSKMIENDGNSVITVE